MTPKTHTPTLHRLSLYIYIPTFHHHKHKTAAPLQRTPMPCPSTHIYIYPHTTQTQNPVALSEPTKEMLVPGIMVVGASVLSWVSARVDRWDEWD